jgi:hypothetical protein
MDISRLGVKRDRFAARDSPYRDDSLAFPIKHPRGS